MRILILFLIVPLVCASCSASSKCFTLKLVDIRGAIRNSERASSIVGPGNPPAYHDHRSNLITTLTFELTFKCFSNYQGHFILYLGPAVWHGSKVDLIYPKRNARWTAASAGHHGYNYTVTEIAGYYGSYFMYVYGDDIDKNIGYSATPISAGMRHRFVLQMRNYQPGTTWFATPIYGLSSEIQYQDSTSSLYLNDVDCILPKLQINQAYTECNVRLVDVCQAGCNCFKVQLVDMEKSKTIKTDDVPDGYQDPFCDGVDCLTTLVFEFIFECPVRYNRPMQIWIDTSELDIVFPTDNMHWKSNGVNWIVSRQKQYLLFETNQPDPDWNQVKKYMLSLQARNYQDDHLWIFHIIIGSQGPFSSHIYDRIEFNTGLCLLE